MSWQQNQTQTPPPQDTQTQTQTQSESQDETELLTAADVKIYTASVAGTPVSYLISQKRDEALFIARDLPEPAPNSTYQLWIYHGDTATWAGIISEAGPVRQWLDGTIADADRLVITQESTPNQTTNPTGPKLSEVTLP